MLDASSYFACWRPSSTEFVCLLGFHVLFRIFPCHRTKPRLRTGTASFVPIFQFCAYRVGCICNAETRASIRSFIGFGVRRCSSSESCRVSLPRPRRTKGPAIFVPMFIAVLSEWEASAMLIQEQCVACVRWTSVTAQVALVIGPPWSGGGTPST